MRLARSIWWAAAFAVFAIAQTQPARRAISLMEGRGELLQFQNDISRVAISEPKIADAVVVSPREVMVNAKGPGSTTLVVWEGDAAPQRFDIDVTKDNTE
ncbi:MAG TPA: pilus assembly protein N-terminal domain-containing protein, partial [Candidatus Sulfopaludibacter sp.]|nr:pilus assembly protein N-terminal domain-containing protein [Candidatus Sulfopaludibacter sp.]